MWYVVCIGELTDCHMEGDATEHDNVLLQSIQHSDNIQTLYLTTQLWIWYDNMSFQPSMVITLLKGTNKGIRSLLEEGLTITREMLRDAQLAYPRNAVRDRHHHYSNEVIL